MSARASKRPIAVTAGLLRRWALPQPSADGDKEDRGVAMIAGGSFEIPGALLLAGVAALRAGAGKLQLAGPRSVVSALGVAVPEARVFALPETGDGLLDRKAGARAAECAQGAHAILVGPGMLGDEAVRGFMDEFVRRVSDKQLVIDAIALSALRGGRYRFTEETRVVLTPNTGEMARITGKTKAVVEADPRGIAMTVARDLNAVVALKGAETFIATPYGEVFRYSEGEVGLATSGSGDILAGIVVGLLARGATLDQAAVWAVYLHGAAGNRLKRRLGAVGFLARELSDEVPALMNGLSGRRAS
ncbi:MAG TPA: NAD(P)H-hydrate dehydratase [Gemmatimonadaceae bacterium]|nr:NAD(P)H-hydrate dehydratase [Gemmatimonadaceae bacterium]